jgi:poly(beta-D-mannuronate) C5 epimerase
MAFRPFIASYIRSRTFLAGSTFHDLGFHAPTAYGLSLSSQPERDRGEVSEDWPTGEIVGNVFRGLYYGFYSYEARDVAIVGTTYVDNIRYGIDPHDRSTRLIIARNTTKSTRQRHGIIGSRGITDSYIFDNTCIDNTGSGIMLDRHCSGNVIAGNRVGRNGQGIAVYESPDNLIDNNIIFMNTKSGIRVRNSTEIVAQRNLLVGNGDYGFEVYAKRLDDHEKRMARGDRYGKRTGISIHGNTVTGNQGGCLKGSKIEYLGMSGVCTDLGDLGSMADILPANERLNVDDDQRFGGELKPFSSQLERVFDADKPVVEMRWEE